jgi:deoxyhypusine synthase
MLEPDVTVALSMTGALTPAGLGMSAIIPLIEAGFVDWIVSTGANLYHDTHFGIGLSMHRGTSRPTTSSCARRAWCGSTTCSSTTACCSTPTRSSAR